MTVIARITLFTTTFLFGVFVFGIGQSFAVLTPAQVQSNRDACRGQGLDRVYIEFEDTSKNSCERASDVVQVVDLYHQEAKKGYEAMLEEKKEIEKEEKALKAFITGTKRGEEADEKKLQALHDRIVAFKAEEKAKAIKIAALNARQTARFLDRDTPAVNRAEEQAAPYVESARKYTNEADVLASGTFNRLRDRLKTSLGLQKDVDKAHEDLVGKDLLSGDVRNSLGKLKSSSPIKVDSVSAFLGNLAAFAVNIMGSIALALFVYAGILWMVSGGNPGRRGKAMQTMLWTGIGLVVIMSSFALVKLVLGIL